MIPAQVVEAMRRATYMCATNATLKVAGINMAAVAGLGNLTAQTAVHLDAGVWMDTLGMGHKLILFKLG